MGFFRKKKTNYALIIAITIATVAVLAIVAFIIYKLVKKYTEDLVYDCDVAIEDADDEIVEA